MNQKKDIVFIELNQYNLYGRRCPRSICNLLPMIKEESSVEFEPMEPRKVEVIEDIYLFNILRGESM